MLLEGKNKIFKDQRGNKKNFKFASNLNTLQNCLTNLIAHSKQKYNARMVNKLISTKKAQKGTGLC